MMQKRDNVLHCVVMCLT